MEPTNVTFVTLTALVLMLQFMLLGCNDGRSKDEVLSILAKEDKFIREVGLNFPDVTQFISHQTGEYGPQDWHVTIGVLNRYELSIQVPIEWDDRNGRLLRHGEPSFYFRRIKSITLTPGGGSDVLADVDFDCLQEFDMDDWKKLRENNFDFAKAFACLKDNDPVTNFKAYIDNRQGK